MAGPVPDSLRYKVKRIYKELLYLGRDYPRGYNHFRPRLHAAFVRKSDLVDTFEIQAAIDQADYLKKEIEAM